MANNGNHSTNPNTKPTLSSLLLDQQNAWEFVGLSRATWFRLRSAGKIPEPVRIAGSSLRWRRSDLEKWVAGLPTGTGRRRTRSQTKVLNEWPTSSSAQSRST